MYFFLGSLPVIHFASIGANVSLDFMWVHKSKAVFKCFFGLKDKANNLTSILLLIENYNHIFG